MNKSNRFSPEVRERAVRLVHEHRGEYPSLWEAVESIAPKFGCVPQTLLEWVKRAEVDAGDRLGMTTAEVQRMKELERENKELRRANDILRTAVERHLNLPLRRHPDLRTPRRRSCKGPGQTLAARTRWADASEKAPEKALQRGRSVY